MATIRKRPLPSGLVRWQVDVTDQAGKRRSKLFPRRRANEDYRLLTMACGGFVRHVNDVTTKKQA